MWLGHLDSVRQMQDQRQEEARLKMSQGEGNMKVVLVNIDEKIVDVEGQRRLNP